MTRGSGSRGTACACKAQRTMTPLTDRRDVTGLLGDGLGRTLPAAHRW